MFFKIVYYACIVITILQGLLYGFNFMTLAQFHNGKTSEKVTFFVATLSIILALFWSFRRAAATGEHGLSILILVVAWVLILLWVLIMLLFFNGPIRWN